MAHNSRQTPPSHTQRLAKNRESAQRSRQRKKEYLELLQERVHQTNATLEGLRAAHVAAGAPRLAAARAGFLESCAAADAGAGMDEEDVEAFLRAFGPWAEVGWVYVCWYACFGGGAGVDLFGGLCVTHVSRRRPRTTHTHPQERQALLRHDCDRLKGAVLPPPARFWTWLAQQPDAFFTAATEGTPSPSSASASASAPAAAAATSPAVAGVAAAPSAAKAGERLMQEGAASCGAGAELWPLLCFELQLKPEQEAALRRAVFGGGGGGEAQQQGAAAVDVGLAEVAATLVSRHARVGVVWDCCSHKHTIKTPTQPPPPPHTHAGGGGRAGGGAAGGRAAVG